MKKRVLSLFLVVCILSVSVSMFPMGASAATSGICGDNLTWTFDAGTLTISGTGNMYDWTSSSSVPWKSVRGQIKTVKIDNGVTSIGDYAFYYCESLTSITIPDSVTSIGDDAFSGCYSLTSGTCGDNLTWILDDAGTLTISGTGNMYDYDYYYGNDAPWYSVRGQIKTAKISNSVTRIGSWAFSDCYSLTSITIPDKVTSIGDGVFYYCESLTSVTIGNSVTSIGYSAFSYCRSLTSITIPDSVTSIGNEAFSDCESLTSITIPDSVTSIGDDAFSRCYSLTSITIPDSVTSIGDGVFSNCESLTSVTIGNSVTIIGKYAFAGCDSLKNITIPDRVTSIGERAFSYCKSLTSITIPDSVTSIGESAFNYCKGLTSVTIGNSVTSIGVRAFHVCESLTSIEVSSDNANYTSVSGVLFSKNKTSLIAYPSGKKDTEYIIPGSVTSIGNHAFIYCYSLTSITIPDSVTSIGEGAFTDCYSLTSITIPDSVTSIGDGAFYNCYILTSITIPDSITSIGNYAFSHCKSLTSITIPDSVTSIGDDAFYYCYSLTSITIPDSVTSIGDLAFYYCESLTSITIPDSVTSIGDYAFYGCYRLKDVYYSGSESDWKKISIGKKNDNFKNAKFHYYSWNITTKYRSDLISNAWLEFDYSDKYFIDNDGYTYNHDLARASLALELSSWTPKKNASGSENDRYFSEDDRKLNISNLYKHLGFRDVDYHNYDVSLDDHSDKVAYSFATKELYDGSTLVAAVVRGGGYGAEWRSNLHVGTGSKHAGFSIPAQEVYNNLDIYLSANNFDRENTKIWITGYSRGAAVANIVAGQINETGLINSNNLYAYTFATPNGVKVAETGADSSVHDNIYNIVLPYDFVPKVAMENWGYGRYGQTLMVKNINTSLESTGIGGNIWSHERYFFEHTGKKKNYAIGKSQTKASNHLKNALSVFGENQNNYASEYEGLLMDIIEWAMYRKGEKGEDLTEFVFTRYEGQEKFSDALNHAYICITTEAEYDEICKKAQRYGLNQETDVISLIALMCVNGLEMSAKETKKFLDDKLLDILKEINVGVGSVLVGTGGTIEAHNPEYYIAWLYAYDNPKDIYERSTYKKLTIACPVNVNVYDSYGELVASVVNNEVVVDILPIDVIGESAEIYFYEGEDIDDYKIEIEAYDEGNVNYSVTEYENNGVEVRKINYANIPVSTGTKLSGNVPKGQKLEAELYNLTSLVNDEETAITFTDDLSGEDLQNLTVGVTVEGDGSAADIYFATKGELVTLEANPYYDASFVGWYDENDGLISEDRDYSFILSESMKVTAKFTKCTSVVFSKSPKITNNLLNVDSIVSSAKNTDGEYIIAVYSSNDELLDINTISTTLGGNTEIEINENIDVSKYEIAPAYIKLFLWKDLKEIKPLCRETQANIIR